MAFALTPIVSIPQEDHNYENSPLNHEKFLHPSGMWSRAHASKTRQLCQALHVLSNVNADMVAAICRAIFAI
jgi:hypothetical protein